MIFILNLLLADVSLKNKLIFPKAALKKAAEVFNEKRAGQIGQIGYSEEDNGLGVDMNKVSHRTLRVFFDEEKNALMAEIDTLNVPFVDRIEDGLRSGFYKAAAGGKGSFLANEQWKIDEYELITINILEAELKP